MPEAERQRGLYIRGKHSSNRGRTDMAKQGNQKLKLLMLKQILEENTDETHGLTIAQIQALLNGSGIPSERKSLYADMEALSLYGMDIVTTRGKHTEYAVGERPFELAELKLLVDSVQSSRFITRKKSDALIRKLEGLASRYDAAKLHRQVYVSGRVKSMNESIYYSTDKLHTAISENRAITFHYFDWNERKEPVFRNGGALYTVSPFALTVSEENYYLVAYHHEKQGIRHFRVDKMTDLTILEESRLGQEKFQQLDMAAYTERLFGMFGGEDALVTMFCESSLAGVILDRFGRDVLLVPEENGFRFSAHVCLSPVFYGWVISFGGKIRILSPDAAQHGLRLTLQEATASLG